MPSVDDDPWARPAPKKTHQVGEDIGRLSVDELQERIVLLRDEIARVEREIAAKTNQKSAADLVFRR